MKKLSLISALLVSVVIFTGEASAQGRITRPEKPKSEPTEKVRPKTEPQPVAQPKIELSQPDGSINGHGYVDLGLPSGLKWATCNIGASTPEEYGNYYAWGETSTKTTYNGNSYKNPFGNISALMSADVVNASAYLTMSHDAARANWGGTWRMPLKEEFQELKTNCQWTWIGQGKYKGFRITGPNGRSIFLVAAGCREDALTKNAGETGHYWTSMPKNDNSNAFQLILEMLKKSHFEVLGSARYYGFSVRPVSK